MDKGKYYLYRHSRPDKNEIFYIGIGTKKNLFSTLKGEYERAYERVYNRTKYWKNIVAKNPDYEVEILMESDDLRFIKEKEVEFIKLYGRKDLGLGTLVNMTDGGDGICGFKHSEESKEIMSFLRKGRKVSKETREKISKGQKGRKLSEETKQKMSLSKKDIKISKEHKKNISISRKGKGLKPVVFILGNKKIEYISIEEASKNSKLSLNTISRYLSKKAVPREGSWEFLTK